MENTTIWSIKELKSDGKTKKFRIDWSEFKTDTRRGYSIVEARDIEEAEENFWAVKNIIDEGEIDISEGDWINLHIDNIEEWD